MLITLLFSIVFLLNYFNWTLKQHHKGLICSYTYTQQKTNDVNETYFCACMELSLQVLQNQLTLF